MARRRGASSRLLTSVIAIAVTAGLVTSGASLAWAVEPGADPAPSATTAETVATASDVVVTTDDSGSSVVATAIEAPVPAAAEPTPEDETPTSDDASDAEPGAAPVEPEPQPSVPSDPVTDESADLAPADGARASPLEDIASALEATDDAATFWWGSEERAVTGTPGSADVVTLTGTVVDSVTTAPIAGFRVAAVGNGESSEIEIAAATTASDGTFSLAVSPQASYFRLLLESGASQLYVSGSGELDGFTRGFAYPLGTLALQPGAELTGTVTLPASAGAFPVSVQVRGESESDYFSTWETAAGGSTVAWRLLVPAGTYDLSFSDGSAFVEQWWRNAASRDEATALTLTAGQRVGSLDATLAFGTHSISGRVTTKAGTPLSDVSVWASSAIGSVYRSYSASTDADGRYLLGNVAPGSYRLQFTPQRGDGLGTYYGGRDYNTATVVVVPDGGPSAATGIDATITAGATVTGTLPAAAVGKVTSIALRVNGSTSGQTYGWASPRADGTFTLHDIPAGTYRLQFSAGSFTEVWGDAFALAEGQLRAVDVSGYTLELGSIAVTLDLPSASGSGMVELLGAGTRTVVTTTGASGSDIVLTARPGDYLVRYTSYSGGGAPIYYGGGVSPADATVVTIVADQTVPITISGGRGTISGTVTDAGTASGLDGLTVRLYRADNTGTYTTPAATTTTDENGDYTFTGLGVNNYAVQVVGDGQLYVNRWFGPSGRQSDATPIELADGGTFTTADVALTLGGGIAGTFADAAASGRNASLSFTVRTADWSWNTVFSGTVSTLLTDGAFELRGIPAGEYVISGTLANNSFSTTDPITVVAGEITEGVTLALPPAQIVGTVRAAATNLPIGAYVTATWTVDEDWGPWTQTASAYADWNTGAYRLSGIPSGAEVTLKFSRNGSQNVSSQWWQNSATADAATPIVIGPEGSAPFVADASLAPGVPVTGRFIDAVTGQPVGGVSFDGGSSAPDGTFTTSFDGAGDVVFRTYANSSYVASATPLTLPAEGLSGVEVPLQRGYTISGTITAANNNVPLSNVTVRVTDADDEWDYSYPTSTSSDGTFTVNALEPGRYKVYVENYSGLYVAQWFDGVASFDDAQVIELVDRSVSDLDVRMTLGGIVSGRIVDASGQPISGATVGVATAPESGVARLFSGFVSLFAGGPTTSPILDIETTTDADGRFQLPPLEPGDYTLYIYSPETGTTWYNGKSTRAEADIIHVGSGETVALGGDVELPPLEEGQTPRTPEQSLSDTFEIVTHPAAQTVDEGVDVTLSALAAGNPVPTVQWQRLEAGSDTWVDVPDAISTQLVLSASLADHGAAYRAVFMQGDEVRETDAATLTVVAAPTVPAAPSAPTVTDVTTSGATLSWAAPADGGRAITGYEVALYAAGGSTPLRTVSLGAVTTTTLGLDAGTAYEVTVAAKNTVGVGTPSPRASITTVAFTKPDAPTNIVATADSATSFTVTWSAVTPTASAPLTGYRVTVAAGATSVADISVPVGTTTYTVTGLTPDTVYDVGVASVNGIGQTLGAVVDVRTKTLPPAATVPAAPSALRLTATAPTSIQLAWDTPASDGGSALTGYTVTVAHGSDPAIVVPVAADVRAVAVPGLTPETTYTVTVTATNGVGVSLPSAALQATTTPVPVVAPGAPREAAAAATSATTAQVSWLAPLSDGGAAITGYDVVVTRGGQPVTASVAVTGTSAVVSGLLPDTSYVVSVVARNSAGAGAPSAGVALTTPAVVPTATVPGVPGEPQLVSATTDAISLRWDAPASDGGSPITGYRLVVVGGTQEGVGVLVESTSYTVANLIPGTPYLFTVQAINAIGASEESAPSAVITTAMSGGDGSGGPDLPSTGGDPDPGAGSGSGSGGSTPPSEGDLTAANAGGLTVGSSRVVPGGQLTLSGLQPGSSYAAWFFSTPVSAGTVTANAAGVATVTVPSSLPAGSHRLVLTDPATGAIVGWAAITVAGLPATGVEAPVGLVGTAALLLAFGVVLVTAAHRRRSPVR